MGLIRSSTPAGSGSLPRSDVVIFVSTRNCLSRFLSARVTESWGELWATQSYRESPLSPLLSLSGHWHQTCQPIIDNVAIICSYSSHLTLHLSTTSSDLLSKIAWLLVQDLQAARRRRGEKQRFWKNPIVVWQWAEGRKMFVQLLSQTSISSLSL